MWGEKKVQKPPQLTEFESYVLQRIDGLTKLVYGVMGALAVSVALHFVDPLWHLSVLQFP